MAIAFVALGSNLGKRQLALRAALDCIHVLPETRILEVANFRETAPVDCSADSPGFINSVVKLDTNLLPELLITHLLRIERELGRDRSAGINAPRAIDLDLLLYGDLVIDSELLSLPHPRMHLRRFVLEPLAEIAPDVVHPKLHCTAAELLGNLTT